MMVVEEGLTILGHNEPCIGDVMEKGKWMFNPRNQSNHEESHIPKCQSLLNQDIK
jgi:hypothetical protein